MSTQGNTSIADAKISQFTAYTQPLIADVFPIIDAANTTTKKITYANLFNSFNVKAYGAVGDGVTNDSAAVQLAINAAETVASGAIYFPYGTYLLNATLNMTHSRTWYGDGWGSILKVKNSTNIFAITMTPNVSDYIDGAQFLNFKIDCNGANQSSAGGGIYGKGAVWCKFDHLWITKPWNNGLQLIDDNLGSYGHHNSVFHCLFDEGAQTNGGDGRAILLDQSDENYINFNSFQTNGRAAASEPNQIYDKAGLNEFIGNSFVGGQTGLKLQGEHNRAIGNVFDGTIDHSMRVNGHKNLIVGNHFYKVGVTGTANTIDGIFVDNVSENNIYGNTFEAQSGSNAARYAINFANGAVDNRQSNNIFATQGSGTWGTGTVNPPATTQSATPTINTNINNVFHITALAQAITSMTTNLSGSPVEGDSLRINITDNGTARAITWGASFEASTVALPTTTVISTRLEVGFVWNSVTSKWRCVASA